MISTVLWHLIDMSSLKKKLTFWGQLESHLQIENDTDPDPKSSVQIQESGFA
jgi:hypothetical protein